VAKTFYSTTEVADLLKVNRVTVYRWVRDGKISAYGIGKHIKIHTSEVGRLLHDFGLSGDVLDELCGGEENNCFDASARFSEDDKTGEKLVVAVDDDEAILDCIRELFAQGDLAKHCRLMTFSDSVEAALVIGGRKPDLLVLDVIMDHLNGIELAEKVRLIFEDVKIVFLSGYPGNGSAERIRRIHPVEFLVKPIDLAVLSGVIKRALAL